MATGEARGYLPGPGGSQRVPRRIQAVVTRDQRFFLGFASAWREKYTPELTKLIIASDPHSPDMVRANATPSNVDAFAKAFGCKAGDAMVNSGNKKVVIW